MPVQHGTTVEVRGRSWFLRSLVARADCRELHLEVSAADRGTGDVTPVVLLEPFDRPVPLEQAGRLFPVSRRAWMVALRAAFLCQHVTEGFSAAACAGADLFPHQLEPALAVVRHGARRVLLADAVGLGKTIEAGFVLAELRGRSELERALVVAPPGICDQWCAELSGRFGLDAAVVDSARLRALRAVLPPGVNPWSVPGVHVASPDFAKRPEVRRSIEHLTWDAFVIDEAHLAAGDSERRAAVHAFASRARVVLLITATPHSGDPRGFHALCRIGALGQADPIVMFRRTREEAGINGRRRVHLNRVEPSEAERAVRRRLDEYIRTVWVRRRGAGGRDARLAMIVLLKRSLSGMGPLCRSLVTRLERIGMVPGSRDAQLPLRWAEDEEADAPPAALLGASGFDDEQEERRVLASLAQSAGFAEAHDSKQRALGRILRRVQEPAIVFTEYRDTLEALRAAAGAGTAVLHGGMDRFERAEAVDRFNRGGARVLLATDAAGVGLNLQLRCRLVVNLELPWNPMRLEQRIGRVDRIGQRRTVHVINLLAAGTAEADILARLAHRLGQARSSIGAMEDVLGASDDSMMGSWLGIKPQVADARAGSSGTGSLPRAVRRLDLRAAAGEAVAHLNRRRHVMRAARDAARPRSRERRVRRPRGVPVTALRRSRSWVSGGREGLLVVFRIRSQSSGHVAAFTELVPVFAEGPWPRMPRRRDVLASAEAAMAAIVPRMAAVIPPPDTRDVPGRFAFDRDALLAARANSRRAVQRGLFDRRAEREADAREAHTRVAVGPGSPGGTPLAPEPVLLLFVTS